MRAATSLARRPRRRWTRRTGHSYVGPRSKVSCGVSAAQLQSQAGSEVPLRIAMHPRGPGGRGSGPADQALKAEAHRISGPGAGGGVHHSGFHRTEWPERTPPAGFPVVPAGGGGRGPSGRLHERRARPPALSGANLSRRPSARVGRDTSQREAYASGHRRSPQKEKNACAQ